MTPVSALTIFIFNVTHLASWAEEEIGQSMEQQLLDLVLVLFVQTGLSSHVVYDQVRSVFQNIPVQVGESQVQRPLRRR